MYKSSDKILAFLVASPLAARGEDRLPRRSTAKAAGEGFSNSTEVKAANPHPTLSLGKGEANQRANVM